MSAERLELCSACNTPTTKTCGRCKSARYCSSKCQMTDWAVHRLLCKTYSAFDISSRPSEEHYKAILFPAESEKPTVIWFDVYESGAINSVLGHGFSTASTTPDYDQVLSRELPLETHILYRDNFISDGSQTNESVAAIGATREGWYYPWRGPIIVFGSEGSDKEQPDGRHLDMNDFAHIANFFLAYEQPARVRQPPAPVGVLGVRINCNGDRKLLNRPKFEKILISQENSIFYNLSTSDIAERVDLPIYTQRCSPDPIWRDNAIRFNNQKAGLLHLCCNPKAEMNLEIGVIGFGYAPLEWQNSIGSVIVVRQDKKPLSTLDVEVLCKYCRDDILPLFAHFHGEYAEVSPMTSDDILAKICRSTFATKWNNLREEKHKAGDTTDYNNPYDL